MNHLLLARAGTGMQRIGQVTARALKTLAGIDRDEPAQSWVFALYTFLLCIAMVLGLLWVSGAHL